MELATKFGDKMRVNAKKVYEEERKRRKYKKLKEDVQVNKELLKEFIRYARNLAKELRGVK